MNIAALTSEIANDPLTIGYSSMTDQQVADSLNGLTRTRQTPISSAELLAWSGAGADASTKCRYERIQEAAATHGTNAVRGAAVAALGMIERDGTSLDLSRSDRMAMLNAIVAGGVLTAGEKDELLALGAQSISRADELGLGIVGDGHVASARGQ